MISNKRCVIFLYLLVLSPLTFAQLKVDTTKNVDQIIKTFFSSSKDLLINNIQYSGNKQSIGLFNNSCFELNIKKGIIISTGNVCDAVGPNNLPGCGESQYFEGDKDLETIANGKTYDAAFVEFDFSANSDSISFDYIFASEEYPFYINKGLNDTFAFLVSDLNTKHKRNLALYRNKPVMVDQTTLGKESFLKPNNKKQGCLYSAIQYNGVTELFTSGMKITPYQVYHFKMGITDVGDGKFDSAIMVRSQSFTSSGNKSISQVSENIADSLKNYIVYFNNDSSGLTLIPNINFSFDSSVLPDTSLIALMNISRVLQHYFDFNIEVVGYTDSIGTNEYNKELSLKRANAVATYLIEQKVKEERISQLGLGATNPISNNQFEACRAKNRRVLIRLRKK